MTCSRIFAHLCTFVLLAAGAVSPAKIYCKWRGLALARATRHSPFHSFDCCVYAHFGVWFRRLSLTLVCWEAAAADGGGGSRAIIVVSLRFNRAVHVPAAKALLATLKKQTEWFGRWQKEQQTAVHLFHARVSKDCESVKLFPVFLLSLSSSVRVFFFILLFFLISPRYSMCNAQSIGSIYIYVLIFVVFSIPSLWA